jgi:DNA polymerase-3 subunit epsilon/ATP-dependent DNA helicase DinG
MPTTYVSLDLETTGLDPDRDAIMEIGAVRFGVNGTEASFSKLVDPRKPIPYRIQQLTSITDEDVRGQPMFAEIGADLEEFIGDCAIVGQNPKFDLDFLEQQLIKPRGPVYDTQELAGLLIPDLLQQNLAAIAAYLGIEFPTKHRALADASAAKSVFLALRERIGALPHALLNEAAKIASITDWAVRFLLQEVLDEQGASSNGYATGLVHGALRPPKDPGPPLARASDDAKPVDSEIVIRLLTSSAREAIEQFEERPEQVEMARAVASSLNNNEDLIVEAGTGVGKSLAYLLPSAMYAAQNDTRVVVSTNTINLQEQLTNKDIPVVQELLGGEENLRAATLKGRRNYLCLLRWSNLRRSDSLTKDEAKLLVRLLLWLPHTETGDKSELRLSQGEEPVWSRISAQNDACTSACPFVRDGTCFMSRARRRAEAAHVLVVNHALLLSDIVVGGGVVPEYGHLVIDEAHHLETEATDQFGFAADENAVADYLDAIIARGSGLIARVRSITRGLASQIDAVRQLGLRATSVEASVERAREMLPDFFMRLSGFVRQQSSAPGDYDERLRLNRSMRVQPDWADVEMAWEDAAATLGEVTRSLDGLLDVLQGMDASDLPERDALLAETGDLIQAGTGFREGIASIVLKEDAGTICWLTDARNGGGAGLASAPLRVSEILDQRLFSQKDSVVLTSATLSVEGTFDYLRGTLGLADANDKLLGSPFDYAGTTAVLVPHDMPEPNQVGYLAALQESLIDLIRATRGRALVLFTSHASLRAAYGKIKGPLEDEGIMVLGHNLDGSPRHLIQTLREHPHAAVLGTASFWEGVDVAGDALSLLVMARLPFSVPSDPVFQARSELYDDPFAQYAVPQAALRFKQGFGRLIRRKTDRGVMVMLDGRIHSKQYGASFLRSLPACTVRQAAMRELPGLVGEWLGDPDAVRAPSPVA